MQTIVALLEVILPSDHGLGQAGLVFLVNRATQSSGGVLEEYRRGAALIDSVSRGRFGLSSFAAATQAEREAVLESLLWRYSGGDPRDATRWRGKVFSRLERLFQTNAERRFRQFVIRDLLTRFYAGAGGWKLVGYSTYPGVATDPRAYTAPPRNPTGEPDSIARLP